DIVSNPSSSFRAEGHASNHTLGYKIHVLIDVLESIVDVPVRTLVQSFGKKRCDTFSRALKRSLSVGESLLGSRYQGTRRIVSQLLPTNETRDEVPQGNEWECDGVYGITHTDDDSVLEVLHRVHSKAVEPKYVSNGIPKAYERRNDQQQH